MTRVLLVLLPLVAGLPGSLALGAETQPGSPPLAVLKFRWFVNREMPDPFDPVVTPVSTPDVTPSTVLWGEKPRGRMTTPPAQVQQPAENVSDAAKKPAGFPNTNSAMPQPSSEKAAPATPGMTFLYEATVQNLADRPIQAVTWDYVFTDPGTRAKVARLRFMSSGRINPGKSKKISASTNTPPTRSVGLKELRKVNGAKLDESVAIVRIQYADGSVWHVR